MGGKIPRRMDVDAHGKVMPTMAKKKTAAGVAAGTRIRVKPGVMSPEFPEISLAGWSGSVMETSGKPPLLSYIVEWDAQTLSAMPADYRQKCEAQQLLYSLANLPETAVEVVVL